MFFNHLPTSAEVFPSSPKKLIRFLCECIVKVLKGNLQSIKRRHMIKFQYPMRLVPLKRITWKHMASEKGLQLIKGIPPSVINHLPSHGKIVLVPAFVHNKSLVVRQLQSMSFQSIQLNNFPQTTLILLKRKEKTKSFVQNKTLLSANFCPVIVSISQFGRFLDGVEAGVLPSVFAQQLHRKNANLPYIYFTLLNATGISPTRVRN